MATAEVQRPPDAAGSGRPSDPRARRTRAQLMTALVDLASHADLDEISIGALTAAAGVNRATFYLHYSDKDALLLDAIDAVTAEISVGAAAASGEELDDADHAPLHTLAFFTELDRHAALYRRVLGPAGSPALAAHLRNGMQEAIAGEITRRTPDRIADGHSIERGAAFVAGGVIAAAITWLGNDDRVPPSEEAAEVWRMVLDASISLRDRTTRLESAPSRSRQGASARTATLSQKTTSQGEQRDG